MRVLMLNTFDEIGGAARASCRLLEGVRRLGVDASLLVHFRSGRGKDVLCGAGPWRRAARRLKVYLGTLPVRRYPLRPENNFSPALLPDRLPSEIERSAPDLIHLHWLGAGFCRIETLRKLVRPLVWTLHDSWAFTGGCHVPFGCERYRDRCGACPVLGSGRETDLSRRTWQRKRAAWRHLNLTLVAPSRWLADCAASSSLLTGCRVEVIPNGLDTDAFRPMEKGAARALLGLPGDRKIVLFGAVRATGDPNKGWHLLKPALQRLARSAPDAQAVVFGAPAPRGAVDVGMPLRFLGELRGKDSLVAAYSAADAFAAPSLQEAFCQTAAESMACGTPVVAFRATGLLDVVEHGANGYLAEPYEVDDFARGLAWVLADEHRRAELSSRARQAAVEKFRLAVTAGRYVELYGELLAGTARGTRP